MTIQELVNELNALIEAGYGDANAVVSIPTLYVSEDRDIETNYYRHEAEDIEFSANDYIENRDDIDKESNEITLHNASYETCSCWA